MFILQLFQTIYFFIVTNAVYQLPIWWNCAFYDTRYCNKADKFNRCKIIKM